MSANSKRIMNVSGDAWRFQAFSGLIGTLIRTVAHRGDLVELAMFESFLPLLVLGASALVELFEHADGAVRLDDGQPTALDLDGESVCLVGKKFLLRDQHHVVP